VHRVSIKESATGEGGQGVAHGGRRSGGREREREFARRYSGHSIWYFSLCIADS
jgi:hypothetical protein